MNFGKKSAKVIAADLLRQCFGLDVRLRTLQLNQQSKGPTDIFLYSVISDPKLLLLTKSIASQIPEVIPFVEDVSVQENETDSCLKLKIKRHDFFRNTIDLIKKGTEDLPVLCKINQHKRHIVEFSSPNIAKPFHCGHLRSTIIGNSLANISSYLGNDVIRINYLGDWGTQFGLLTRGFDEYGDENELKESPIKHLFDVYVRANKAAQEDENFLAQSKAKFVELEQNKNSDEIRKWKLFKELSIQEYRKIYNVLGVTFDEYEFESMYDESAKRCIQTLESLGLIHEAEDGGKMIEYRYHTGRTELVPVAKNDGSTLYLSRDIAAAIERKEKYKFDEMFYVVGHPQHRHFRFLKDIISQMKYDWAKNLHHINFGKIKGMSTRKGEVIFLQDVINESIVRCKESTLKSKTTKSKAEEFERLAKTLGLSAIFVYDLMHPKGVSYDFDWGQVFRFTGRTGVYLQYAHARICSIERNCGVDLNLDCEPDFSALQGESWNKLIILLSQFDDILKDSSEKSEPSILVRYLLELSHKNNACVENSMVKDQQMSIAQTRLLMFHCTRKVLSQGMGLIGLQPLNQI